MNEIKIPEYRFNGLIELEQAFFVNYEKVVVAVISCFLKKHRMSFNQYVSNKDKSELDVFVNKELLKYDRYPKIWITHLSNDVMYWKSDSSTISFDKDKIYK